MLKVDILAIYLRAQTFVCLTEYDVSGVLVTNGIYVEEISFLENFYHEWKLKVVKHLEMTMSFLSFILFIWCVKLTDEHVTFFPKINRTPS